MILKAFISYIIISDLDSLKNSTLSFIKVSICRWLAVLNDPPTYFERSVLLKGFLSCHSSLSGQQYTLKTSSQHEPSFSSCYITPRNCNVFGS